MCWNEWKTFGILLSWEHTVVDSGGRQTQGDHGYTRLARGRWSPGILPSQLPVSRHFPLFASYSPRTQTSQACTGRQLQPVHRGAAETPGPPHPPPLCSIGAAALNLRGLAGRVGVHTTPNPPPPQPTSLQSYFPVRASLLDVSLCFHCAPLLPLTREV